MTKNMFKAHLDRHASGKGKKAMNCMRCGRNFSQFKSLYQHLIQTHGDVTQEEIDALEASHAKCPLCQVSPAIMPRNRDYFFLLKFLFT